MEKDYYTYIISNKNITTFYVGVTSNLENRILEHKTKKYPKSFSARYNLDWLVYYEAGNSAEGAIAREKQLKNWHRDWKLNLIRTTNPLFIDLSADWQI